MATRRLGIIMNGITGRMGTNQHLVCSVLVMRAQGGVALSNGAGTSKKMPAPKGGDYGKVHSLHRGIRVIGVHAPATTTTGGKRGHP